MPKRISVQPDFGLDELEARYRQAIDPVEACHYQIIWLLAQGRPTDEVAVVTGYSRSWIYNSMQYRREFKSSLSLSTAAV